MLTMLSLVAAVSLGHDYDASLEALEATRVRLAAAKPRSLETARTVLEAWLVDTAFPAWAGTPWDFNGVSQTPGEGRIACGYYVSTLLSHAGVRVERVRLAQQASARIVRTLASTVDDFAGDAAKAVERVRARGNGLYVVGLDNHVGFLVVRAGAVRFCHSSYVGETGVVCEAALESPAFGSRRYVIGEALSDRVVGAWLEGAAIAVVK